MPYIKKGNDIKFRRVSLRSDREPEFENFVDDSVSYPPSCVLEILKTDGSTAVEYERDSMPFSIVKRDGLIYIPKAIPTERMWVRVRDSGKMAMAYKIPSGLSIQDNYQIFQIPAGAVTVEVFGDKYFSAAYELTNP